MKKRTFGLSWLLSLSISILGGFGCDDSTSNVSGGSTSTGPGDESQGTSTFGATGNQESSSSGDASHSGTATSGATSGSTDGGSEAGSESCDPGELRCEGSVPHACLDGQWVGGVPCRGGCLDGTCTECAPGESRCLGAVVQQCDEMGTWYEEETCPVVCSDGACTGVCEEGEVACGGLATLVECVEGAWTTTGACPAP